MSHAQSNQTELSPESIAAGHEVTDASTHALLIFTITLAVTLVAIVLIALGLFYMFAGDVDSKLATENAGSPLSALEAPSPAPPVQPALGDKNNPLHETLPYQDWNALKSEYDHLAGTYSGDDDKVMADHQAHNRMPVDAAIDILADQGFPTNTATDIPTPLGSGTSSSTPYSDGGRGSSTGKAAAPGVPPHQE
jgi:hypothetical protein